MDLYMAGSTFAGLNEWLQRSGYNKLQSYLNDQSSIRMWENYYRNELQCNSSSKLFIDSGAFTAWTQGATIDVDAYIDWLNEKSDIIALFGQVDSIPGEIKRSPTSQEVEEAAEKTWQNYLYMRKRVKNKDGLLYTFHIGEPYKYLEQALEWRDEDGSKIEYMALGGMVGKPMPNKTAFLDRCFNIIKHSSNPNIKVHAFGMTSLPLLEKYPITSADSTSWIMTAVTGSIFSPYGTICLSVETQSVTRNVEENEEQRGLFSTTEVNRTNFIHLSKAKQDVITNYINSKGFKLEELQTDYKQREEFNIMYLQEWAQNYKYVELKVQPKNLFIKEV